MNKFMIYMSLQRKKKKLYGILGSKTIPHPTSPLKWEELESNKINE